MSCRPTPRDSCLQMILTTLALKSVNITNMGLYGSLGTLLRIITCFTLFAAFGHPQLLVAVLVQKLGNCPHQCMSAETSWTEAFSGRRVMESGSHRRD